MSQPLLDARGLVRAWKLGGAEVRGLDGVDLQVRRGEFVALTGPSGSGKSTLLTILGCLDRPDAGTYHLDGASVARLSDRALAEARNRRIGFVFQSFHLLPLLRADENVALPLRYAGWSLERRLTRARALLDRVGLGTRAHHRPDQLSGGQCQRVAIARALAADPALLCADEPTGNLDRASGRDILQLFRELHAEGRTIVMVTHDADVAAAASRRVRLEDGRVQSDDGPGGAAQDGATPATTEAMSAGNGAVMRTP